MSKTIIWHTSLDKSKRCGIGSQRARKRLKNVFRKRLFLVKSVSLKNV